MDPGNESDDPASPAQSGQNENLGNNPDYGFAVDNEVDDRSREGPSGSEQVNAQPGFSMNFSNQANNGDGADNSDQQPASSSPVSLSLHNRRNLTLPDDGSNSEDFWGASSSASVASRENANIDENSRDSNDDSDNSRSARPSSVLHGSAIDHNQQPLSTASSTSSSAGNRRMNLNSSIYQPHQSTSTSSNVVVSVASFSPQPSSSGGNRTTEALSIVNPIGNHPSQSTSTSNPAIQASENFNPMVSESSSAEPNVESNVNSSISSSGNEDLRCGSSFPGNMDVPSISSMLSSSSSNVSGLDQASHQPLHGEISNPPSPLGGSRPTSFGLAGRCNGKRDYPDSPLPGSSGLSSSSNVNKKVRRIPSDEPVPGPSGLRQMVSSAQNAEVYPNPVPGPSGVSSHSSTSSSNLGNPNSAGSSTGNNHGPIPGSSGLSSNQGRANQNNSSEAAAAASSAWNERSPSQSPSSSPSRAPPTPGDSLMISSSTGMVDSVPPTPVDIHDDNDLSVPSPNPAIVSIQSARRNGNNSGRNASDMDDMIDSTVDSTGLSLGRGQNEEVLENSEFCQSSRCIDSSDDENDKNDDDNNGECSSNTVQHSRTTMSLTNVSNDENISTSGQVDEGQFRLVPNEPEDDIFNQRHPPKSDDVQSSSDGRSTSSSRRTNNSSTSPYENPQPGPSRYRDDLNGRTDRSNGASDPMNFNLATPDFSGDNVNAYDSAFDQSSSQDQVDKNGVTASSSVNKDQQSSNGNAQENDEPFLSADLQLEENSGLEGVVTLASFQNIDSDIDLEDIQLQKFLPDHCHSSSTASSSSTAFPSKLNANSRGNSNSFQSTSKLLSLSELKNHSEASNHDSRPFGMRQEQSSAHSMQQDHYVNTNGLSIGSAFTGIPPSLATYKSCSEKNTSVSQSNSGIQNASIINNNNNITTCSGNQQQQQHSSILESMTGPLSKRLRTLHSLQQKQSSSPATSASGDCITKNEVTGKKNSTSLALVNERQNDDSNDAPLDTDSNHSNSQGRENQGNGEGPNGSGGGASFLGGTQQNYSVLIETTGPITMKPKRMFEQKSLNDVGLTDPWQKDKSDEVLLNTSPKRPKRTISKRRSSSVLSSLEQSSMVIPDAPVQSRAKASLPSTHLVLKETKSVQALGVFAKKRIPNGTRFGPIEGQTRRVSESEQKENHNGILFSVITDEGHYIIDTNDEESSNWMRFVRPSSGRQDQNLSLIQDSDQLFFITTRPINPRQELRVSYSPEYAVERDLEVPMEENVREENDNVWPCFECNRELISSEELQKHLDEHDKELNVNQINHFQPGSHRYEKKRVKVLLPEKQKKSSKYPCPICTKKFNKQQSLDRHLTLHRGEKNFECDECNMKFSHSLNLIKHKKKVHEKDPSGKRKRCSSCGLWFSSMPVYRVHLFSHHRDMAGQNMTVEEALVQAGRNPEEARSGEMKFQCPECLFQYENWLDLVHHSSEHGSNSMGIESLGQSNSPTGSESSCKENNINKQHKCELCYKSFSTEDRLQRHMAAHDMDETKPLQCNHCSRRFLSNSALACHVKIHAESKTAYDCPICGKVFQQISALKEHVHVHCINGEYECPHCKKTFSEYPLVRKHIRAFHGEKKFVCPTCHKSFASADKLKIHVVVHSDVKEFPCLECGKEFKRKDKLREHARRMHTNKSQNEGNEETASKGKSFSTDESDRSQDFSNASQSLRNKETKFVPKVSPSDYHRFIYKCHDCFLGFKRRGMLVNHLAKRHPDVPPQSVPELNLPILKATKDFYCQYCSKVYKSSSKRKLHILKNHPGKQLPQTERVKTTADCVDVYRSTFSATVGSITSVPHGCQYCHKQYASNAKLLQHQRKEHLDKLPPEKQVPRGSSLSSSSSGISTTAVQNQDVQHNFDVNNQQEDVAIVIVGDNDLDSVPHRFEIFNDENHDEGSHHGQQFLIANNHDNPAASLLSSDGFGILIEDQNELTQNHQNDHHDH